MPGNDTGQARVIAGRYRVVGELGRGGMGVVWLADDELAGRRVAVKELRPPRGLGDGDRGVYQRRALQEARSSARVHHPGAVTLFDVLPATAADEAVYLIMELVEGPSLAAVIGRDGALPDAAVVSLALQLLDVLAAAHGLGIVHRDVKPGNILLAAGGQVKLTDFGIAHTIGQARLTRGGIMGTQAYMAPELFNSQPITPAADLWSLGATLYCAVAGQGPFDRDTTEATLRAILIDEVPVPDCSAGLARAITGLLQRDPAQRATIGQARLHLQQAEMQDPSAPITPEDSRLAWDADGPTRLRSDMPTPDAAPEMPAPEKQSPQGRPPRRVSRKGIAIAAVAAAVVAAAGVTGGILATRTGSTTEAVRVGRVTQVFDASLPANPARANVVEGFRTAVILYDKSQENLTLVSPVTAYFTGSALGKVKSFLASSKTGDVIFGGTSRFFKTRVAALSGSTATITTCDDVSNLKEVNPNTGAPDPAYNAAPNLQYYFEIWKMVRLGGHWAVSAITPVTLPDSRAEPCQPLPAGGPPHR